jgi:hypothetical protein
MTVPKDVTVAVVEDELQAANAYVRRHSWSITWQKEELAVLFNGKHPADDCLIRWRAEVADYRAMPPAWTCFQVDDQGATTPRFPKAGTVEGGVGSIFHPSGVICAPFNRLAFKVHAGPHDDWGGPADWLQVRGKVRATVLAEMIAQIVVHLKYSPGWL